jgi:hypothetical protein
LTLPRSVVAILTLPRPSWGILATVLCEVDQQRLLHYALRLTFAHPYRMARFSGGMSVRMWFLRVMRFFLESARSHAQHPRQTAKP